jgi:hypothetical protein
VGRGPWQFAPLMDDASCRGRGWKEEPPDRAERVRAFLDGYGLNDFRERERVLALVSERIRVTLSGIEKLAAGGDATAWRLEADGVTEELRRNLAWLADNSMSPSA